MSKRYKIDLEFLDYIKNIINSSQLETTEGDILALNRIFQLITNKYSCEKAKVNVGQIFNADLEIFDFYKPFYPFVRYFRNHGLVGIQEDFKYEKVCLSDEDTILLVRDFFKESGVPLANKMDDFLEEAPDHLEFIPPTSHTEGEVAIIKSTGDFFCLVPDYESLTKATILVHETTHIFDCWTNPSFLSNYLINEFNALFMELISADYFARTLGIKDDNIKRRSYLHYVIKRESDDVYFRTQILHTMKRSKNNSMKKIYDIFNARYLEYLAESSLIDNYTYQISYLIAIELYTIYQKDRDKALWIASRLVELEDEIDILEELRKYGIELNEHSLSYEKSLSKALN